MNAQNLGAQALKRIELEGGKPPDKRLRARNVQRSDGPPPPLETRDFKERHTPNCSWKQHDVIKDRIKEVRVLAPISCARQIITREGADKASRKDEYRSFG